MKNLPDGQYDLIVSTIDPNAPGKADYWSPSAEVKFSVVNGKVTPAYLNVRVE